MPQQLGLLSIAERQSAMADTSLEAYGRILRTLNEREIYVFLTLDQASQRCGGPQTGGELAQYMGWLVTSVRPRLTGLERKGWIAKLPARESRIIGEGRCHPYRCAVPRAAVERMKK